MQYLLPILQFIPGQKPVPEFVSSDSGSGARNVLQPQPVYQVAQAQPQVVQPQYAPQQVQQQSVRPVEAYQNEARPPSYRTEEMRSGSQVMANNYVTYLSRFKKLVDDPS